MSKPNFNFIENTPVNYDLFKKDYLNKELTVAQIREKYGIGERTYQHFRKQVENDTGFSRKRSKMIKKGREPKYYHKNALNNNWTVRKRSKKEDIYFGAYSNEKKAKEVVEFLKKHNWSKEAFEEKYGKIKKYNKRK